MAATTAAMPIAVAPSMTARSRTVACPPFSGPSARATMTSRAALARTTPHRTRAWCDVVPGSSTGGRVGRVGVRPAADALAKPGTSLGRGERTCPAADPDRRKRKKIASRVEKSAVLDLYSGGGDCPGHDLWAVGGHVHERHALVDGTQHDEPLPYRLLKRATRARSTAGTTSCASPAASPTTADATLSCTQRRSPTTASPRTPSTDAKGIGFDRAEYLRQLPPESVDYEQAYRTRNDSESHSQLEGMHYFHRLLAYGAARQTLVMIGALMSENSISRYHHARRQAQAAEAA